MSRPAASRLREVTLVDQVHAALQDCPRTCGELAQLLHSTRGEVSKALCRLVATRRARISEDPDPETQLKVYEANIP